ncbi:uncharacterized protein [Rutidosis leptorrhynchoides]|uniref:uncharacterized protein n=1 Tax=Rutidosis leptorrhynchoides TaxID=125765 RepID=UPI003A99100E
MDSSWLYFTRESETYEKGLDEYLDYMFKTEAMNGQISCPCKDCRDMLWVERDNAKMHLICVGFMKGYRFPAAITKQFDSPIIDAEDDMSGLVQGAFHWFSYDEEQNENLSIPNINAEQFYNVLRDSKKELYPGCKKFSVLSFIIRLYHSKCVGKCNDKGFNMILDTVREAFPDATIPKSLYEVRKIIRDLGLGYEKIDACENDCMLYWKENKDKIKCDVCNKSRYKESRQGNEDDQSNTADDNGQKIGAKVLRYFPLIPRLQRLFMSPKTAVTMRWHEEGRTKDGFLRHPADSPTWKTLDSINLAFAKDVRNVRLGLASDGFNPFGNKNLSHNVYMRPLVDELKELWDTGVMTYDSSTKTNFYMRAGLLWTISDFPAYANLSGWSTKGQLSCPCCHKYTISQWLTFGKIFCFMGHTDLEIPLRYLTGAEVLEELNGCVFKFGKLVKDNPDLPYNWKKWSIFFELPYWEKNLIRHNLDVMHTEKNVCDNVVGTLMNIDGKTKDHLKARRDLKAMGIRKELHPQNLPNDKVYLPPTCYSLSKNEKERFYEVLKGVKVPDGYASNISRCIQLKPLKMSNLKSHDNHTLMQQLLPVAIRDVLPKHVHSVVMKLCRYYRQLCSKVLNPNDLVQMEHDIIKILRDLERIFPPSFFDVMVHLSVHLASEAKLGGPVQYCWMYPVESKPEGSIAEGYLADVCLSFCSLYLSSDVKTIHNKKGQNYQVDGNEDEDVLPIFSMSGHHIGASHMETVDQDNLAIAHSCVLFNCSEIEFLRTEHLAVTRTRQGKRKRREREIQQLHSDNFASWFHEQALHAIGDNRITADIRKLVSGPDEMVKKYNGYVINGYRFNNKHLEKNRRTQNSGVMLAAITNSFASARDNNPIMGYVTYYGVINYIVELQYAVERSVVLFHCDWIPSGSSIKFNENGYTTVNFDRLRTPKEPFILASQAQQVFYVADCVHKGLKVVIKVTHRDFFNMDEQTCIEDVDEHLQSDIPMGPQVDEILNIDLVRTYMEGTVIENTEVDVEVES